MKSCSKSVISLILLPLILVSMFVPTFAAGGNYTGEVSGWWDQLMYAGIQNAVDYDVDLGIFRLDGSFKGFAQWCAGTASNMPWVGHGTVCSVSEDALHHAEGFVDNQPHYDKDGNLYALARCSYCGANFNVYASDLQQSYDAQVAELPAPRPCLKNQESCAKSTR